MVVLHFGGHGFKTFVVRPVPGFIVERGVDAPPVIVALDIGEPASSGVFAGRPSLLMDELDLEGVEGALHRSIVITKGGSAHRGFRLYGGELLAVRLGYVLATTVGMTDETFGRPLPLRRHH